MNIEKEIIECCERVNSSPPVDNPVIKGYTLDQIAAAIAAHIPNLENHNSSSYVSAESDAKGVSGMFGATPHIFRHSYLSAMVEAGVDPKLVQKIGGHAHYNTTMDFYVHTRPELIKQAGNKVSSLLV